MKFLGKYRTLKEMYEKEDVKNLERIFPHGKPMTRRDLLSSGAIGFAATLTAPSILSLLSPSEVLAQSCSAKTLPSLVTLNLAGGAAMSGNIIPLDQGRQMLQSYDRIGLGSSGQLANQIITDFGGTKFFAGSGMLTGIRARITQATADNTACVAIWNDSQDDSAGNKFDISGMVIKAGLQGSILPNLGVNDTATGIRQEPAFKAPPTPLRVTSADSISNALGVNGSLGSLNNDQKSRLFTLINRLSESQKRRLASVSGGKALGDLVERATGDNVPLVSSDDNGTNPLLDDDSAVVDGLDQVWSDNNGNPLSQNNNMGSRDVVSANVVYNALKGNASTAGLEMGGYDYHGSTRAQQTAMDNDAGQRIGQILESARIMNRATLVMVTTDGAVGASGGSTTPGVDNYNSDRGRGGGLFIFAYDPNGRPASLNALGNADYQVGHFRPGRDEQAADGSFLTGNEPELAAVAAFLNYCSLAGNIGLFSAVTGGLWNSTQIDQALRLRKVG